MHSPVYINWKSCFVQICWRSLVWPISSLVSRGTTTFSTGCCLGCSRSMRVRWQSSRNRRVRVTNWTITLIKWIAARKIVGVKRQWRRAFSASAFSFQFSELRLPCFEPRQFSPASIHHPESHHANMLHITPSSFNSEFKIYLSVFFAPPYNVHDCFSDFLCLTVYCLSFLFWLIFPLVSNLAKWIYKNELIIIIIIIIYWLMVIPAFTFSN